MAPETVAVFPRGPDRRGGTLGRHMTLLVLDDLKARLTALVTVERSLAAVADRRSVGWKLYLEARNIVTHIETGVMPDDPTVQDFVAKALPVLKERMRAMETGNAYNPISVEISEKTELDLFVLQKYLAHEDHLVRLEAVTAAGELEYAEALTSLEALLATESHPWVLSKLTKVLAQLGGIKLLPKLEPFLGHEDARVRANTVEGIGAFPGDEKLTVLLPLLDDESPRVRANVLAAIKTLGTEHFTQVVRTMCRHPSLDHRRSVLFALGAMQGAFARDCLITLLQDDYPEIRGRAIDLLGRKPDLPAVDALLSMVRPEAREADRERAVMALRTLVAGAPPELVAEIETHFSGALATVRGLRGSGAAASTGSDPLADLLEICKPVPVAPKAPEPEPVKAAEPAPAPEPEAAVAKEFDPKKLLARMSGILSSLDARERKEAEGLVKAGKVQNESQLQRAIARLRGKKASK